MQIAHALVQRLKNYQPLEEIFLLGDILDLQLATWSQAIEGRILDGPAKRTVGFRYFLNFLIRETNAKLITYIPGNHDYKIFDYHSIDRHLILPLKHGKKLSGKVSFFRNFTPSFLQGLLESTDAQFRVIYPHHILRVSGARILLTHGHYFDSSQSFYQEIAKAFPPPVEKEQIPKLTKNVLQPRIRLSKSCQWTLDSAAAPNDFQFHLPTGHFDETKAGAPKPENISDPGHAPQHRILRGFLLSR